MNLPDAASTLSPALRDRVLARLGLATPLRADLNGLRALYGAWCAQVPFDNVRKMIALRAADGQPLPGGHAQDFFEDWLADGTGGTCWATSNALFELARSLGFDAQRRVGCMRDLGIVNHGSVKVRIDANDWLVDSSLLYNTPLPLAEVVHVHTDPVFAVEVEAVGDGNHLLWVELPPNPTYLPCRLRAQAASHAFYLSSYEDSRQRSPFNHTLYARRNRSGELLLLLGHTRYAKSAHGLSCRDLDAAALVQALREDIGLSDRVVDAWVRSGGLDASFEAPAGPAPPPVTGEPPSRRVPGEPPAGPR